MKLQLLIYQLVGWKITILYVLAGLFVGVVGGLFAKIKMENT